MIANFINNNLKINKMKNLFLLPTDKPSRLSKYKEELLPLAKGFHYGSEHIVSQNIYITNSEEIKENTNVKDKWVISEYGFVVKADRIENNYLIHSNGGSDFLHHYKFIIMTTDPNLIKDGIQAIEDDFLEWFVNNSNCEKVEVKQEKIVLGEVDGTTYIDFNYKIIIPKEEYKQETLEEVAYKLFSTMPSEISTSTAKSKALELAKWQQEHCDKELEVAKHLYLTALKEKEIMYSEEDMLNFAWFLVKNIGQYSSDKTAHFEGEYLKQFKKK